MQESYSGQDNLEVMAGASHYNAFLLGLITRNIPTNGRVLDFGAGIGTFDRDLRTVGYRHLECLEIDSRMVIALRNQGFTVWNDAKFIPQGHFSAAFSLNVLEHIEDDNAVLSQLHRILGRRSCLLIYVPAFPSLFSSMDRKVGHYRRYQRKTLEAQLRQAGFEEARVRYVDTMGFFAAALFKVVGNSSGAINPLALAIFDRCLFPLNKLLDPVCGYWFGKNLLAVVEKD